MASIASPSSGADDTTSTRQAGAISLDAKTASERDRSEDQSDDARPRKRLTPRQWLQAVPFILVHLAVIGVFWSGVTWTAVWLAVGFFALRIFAITAGYHRYFAHRTYDTSRPMAFILGFLAETSIQKGVLWWAAHHRDHHKHADTERDVHSPTQDGFWYSHVGWILDDTSETKISKVRDLAKYPELRLLNRFHLVPPTLLALLCYAIGGWSGLFVGFFLSTVLLWHATFCINSLAHVFGSRRFDTEDDSRNNFLLALLTFGEGWHNNHHHYMLSARQGFYWWEVDITYYLLKGLEKVGLVWNLRDVPEEILEEGREADALRRAGNG